MAMPLARSTGHGTMARMSRWPALVALLTLLSVASFACGLVPKDGDEEYLLGFCRSANEFSDALVSAEDEGAIESAIEDYAAALGALEPPTDVQRFNDELIAYVESLRTDPTRVETEDPPQPPDNVKRRLDSQASSIDACTATNYFSE